MQMPVIHISADIINQVQEHMFKGTQKQKQIIQNWITYLAKIMGGVIKIKWVKITHLS
jgi:hypothetical protein